MLEPSSSTYFISEIENINSSPLALLGFLLAAILLVVVFKTTPLAQLLSQITKLKPKSILALVISTFLIAFASTLSSFWYNYNVKKSILASEVKSVSGCIANHEVNQGNSRSESFSVSSIIFKYNDVVTENYFFANRKHDTFIRNGQCVSIIFLPGYSNGILKIDKV